MQINKVIIHEVSKQQGKNGAKHRLSNSVMDIENELVKNLVKELDYRYSKRDESYGVFDKENPVEFHNLFANYVSDNSEADFIQFTQKATIKLKDIIDNITPARGGYLVFIEYEHFRNWIGIFLIRDTKGINFNRNATVSSFDITKVEHIDFEKLAMASKINMENYKLDNSRYIGYINKNSDDISQYFLTWLSTSDKETNYDDTLKLYNLIKTITPDRIPLIGDPDAKYDLLEQTIDFIKTSPGRKININDLSEHIFQDREYLNKEFASRNIQITAEFKAHAKVLNYFKRIKAKADNIELSFPHELFNEKVRINENNRNQIIIDSEKLANDIRVLLNLN